MEVFGQVLPILRKSGAVFKVATSVDSLRTLNAGLSEFSQIGKFITLYPVSAHQAITVAQKLHIATRGLTGPRVPFDIQYRRGSLIFYRYGAFRSNDSPAGFVRDSDNALQRDRRAAGSAIPKWLVDPFRRASSRRRKTRTVGPIGTSYFPYKALIQRGKGGVYEAVDMSVSPSRGVIIKEGRRHGETDLIGADGYSRLEHEARVLRSLSRAGIPVPAVSREFKQEGNAYLVIEQICAKPLIPSNRLHPRRTSWRRALTVLDQLEPLVRKIHRTGWVWRDCKPSHVLTGGGEYRLIDFENACRACDTRASPWSSLNYLPCFRRNDYQRSEGTFEDDYALGVIAFQFLAGEFPQLSARARGSIYRRTDCPAALRQRIEVLLTGIGVS